MGFLTYAAQLLRRYSYMHSFDYSVKNPLEIQEHVLMNIINENMDTIYGRKNNFKEIGSVSDFQKNVPINSYNCLAKYIEKQKNGKKNVLTAQDPVFFTMSSGTTGKPKFIPVSNFFIKDHKAGWGIWLYHAYQQHPKMFDGKILALVSPKIEGYTKSGIPYGSMSGLTREEEPDFIKKHYALPYPVFFIKDYEFKYYTILRLALEKDISFLTTPNPSTILLLARKADEYRDHLIDDIENGTLHHECKIDEKIRTGIEKCLKPNHGLADKLRKYVKKYRGLYPKHYWPNLALIGCWKEGSMPMYVRQFKKYFANVPVRDLGLLASEGRSSIPLSDKGGDGVLFLNRVFFEFIKEKDLKKKSPKVYLCDELEVGEEYALIFTNNSGLYRYYSNDIIRVKGYYEKAPLIEFLHKGEHITSMTGEKLTEWQVVNAVRISSKKLKIPIHAFTVSKKWGKVPKYEMLLELHSNIRTDKLRNLIKDFDKQLSKLNSEYASKRKSLRLDAPILKIVKNGSYDKYLASKAESSHDTQIKLPCLVNKFGFERNFKVIKEIIP